MLHLLIFYSGFIRHLQASLAEGFSLSKKAGGEGSASEACDLHAITGNIVYCCKELVKCTVAYKYVLDVSVSTCLRNVMYLSAYMFHLCAQCHSDCLNVGNS